MKLHRLLVPIDGSETADRAVDLALALAQRHGSELIVCNAVDSSSTIAEGAIPSGAIDITPVLQARDDAASALLGGVAERAKAAHVPATIARLDGSAAVAIVSFAEEQAVDAIVMGTQGRQGLDRIFLGSTAEGVLQTTGIPIFVVRAAGRAEDEAGVAAFKRILVAIDESDASAAALSLALDLALSEGSTLVLCTVVEGAALTGEAEEVRNIVQTLLDTAAERAKSRRVDAETVIAYGPASDELRRVATERRADLIAVGTHGRRGLPRLFLGSVAEDVVRHCSTPVLVVHAGVSAR
jgi:nucleotide-binding universal stress UspA family protein